MTMEVCAFNPNGNILAVGGRRGVVHLVDWSHGNGTQVIGSVKMNAPVKALCWTRSGGGRDGTSSQLLTLSEDADIYQWDVGERRCLDRWKDDGGFGSCVMSLDRNDRYLGVGCVVYHSLTAALSLTDLCLTMQLAFRNCQCVQTARKPTTTPAESY